MMVHQIIGFQNRKQAGLLLAEKLSHLRDSRTLVIGVPYGGAVIGYHIASALKLRFDVVACKSIVHPGDSRKSIGSISASDVVIHNNDHDIPRDYIYHQIMQNRNALMIREEFYRSANYKRIELTDADVIIAGDTVKTADTLSAAVKTIRSRNPRSIVIATSLITPDAISKLSGDVEDIVSLAIEENPPGSFYDENTIVRDEDIKDLVSRSVR